MSKKPERTRSRAVFGIQGRILFWLLIVGIAPVVITSVLGHLTMTRSALEAAAERLVRISSETASAIDSRIRNLILEAGHLCTQSPAFQEEVVRAARSPRLSAAELARVWPADSARLTDALLASRVSQELARFLHGHQGQFERLIVTDLSGVVLGASGPLPSLLFQSDSLLAGSQFNYTIDQELLEVVAQVVAPGGGPVVGILRAYSRTSDLQELIEDIKIGQTGFAALLASTGEVLFASPELEVGTRLGETGLVSRLTTEYPSWFQGRGLNNQTHSVIALAPVSVTRGPSHAKLGGASWVVLVEQSKAEVLAAPHQFGRIAVLVVLLTAAVVLVVGLFLSERVVQPLRRLRVGARQLADGRLDTNLDLRTGDEIEDLALEFMTMANRLTELHGSLERKVSQATQELDERNKSLQAILLALAEGLVVIGPDRRIVLWNRAAEQMTGFSATQAVGRPCDEVLRPASTDSATVCDLACRLLEPPLATPSPATPSTTSVLTAEGRVLPVGLSAAPLQDEAGRRTGCVIVLRDLSREQEMDRLKSDMVSIVSHELRTPLGPLIGFAELLRDNSLPEEKRRHYLDIIIEQARRLSGLVDNFLTLSQIEAGRFELHLEDTDLRRLAEDVIAIESAHAPMHRLRNEIPPDLPTVRADPDRIRRVIHNLVSNAIKYSPEGGTVTIAARPVAEEVEVSVSDQGVGIRREDLSRLFERFQRMHKEDLPDVRGTGLGLSICKSIVEEHGGTMRVESRYGKGSTFYFRLPRTGPAA